MKNEHKGTNKLSGEVKTNVTTNDLLFSFFEMK